MLSSVFCLYVSRLTAVRPDYQLPAVIIRKSQYSPRIISKTVFAGQQTKKSRTSVLLFGIRPL
ncbi:hypothetical protein OA40_12390 [Morganella morganii]|nr:hypothetical protein OA40_12390 [Morganella morganii]KNZ89403.1 hypothetical protein AKG16_04285 [Morganella morganii]